MSMEGGEDDVMAQRFIPLSFLEDLEQNTTVAGKERSKHE